MDALIIDPRELRETGFRALSGAIGWVNAVRFLRQLDPGSGNYTEERQTILPSGMQRRSSRRQERCKRLTNPAAVNPSAGGLVYLRRRFGRD
jgi:hypothetical protein